MTEEENQQEFEMLTNALRCMRDCDECDKSDAECVVGIRICLEFLLKDFIKRNKILESKESDAERYVS